MRKFGSWLFKLFREARGNALWDCAKWLYHNGPWLFAIMVAFGSGILGWIKQLPLPALVTLVMAAGISTYLAIRVIARYADNVAKESKTEALSDRKQKLQIACGPNIEGSVAQAWWTINGEPLPVNFFRVVVNATQESQLVKNCTGFLTRIEKDGNTKWGGNNAQVTFAQAEEPDALSKTIRYPLAEYLDVLAVTSRNQVFPGTKPTIGLRLWPFVPTMDEIFSWLGNYLITVVITGDGVCADPITAHLKFNWTGNWETAALTLIQESPVVQISRIRELEHKPLTGIRLRNECDKWIENGKSIHVRLARGEQNATSDAQRWLDEFIVFCEGYLSVSDFDKIHNSNTAGDTFHREMAKLDPSKEIVMHERLLSYRIARLIEFRNKMK